MDIAFANELWSKFIEQANSSGLIGLAYNLERDEPPFQNGDGPRHPDAWLRYLLFRNKVEEMEIPLVEAVIYSLDCTFDADTSDVSFLVFPAPRMPETEEEENEDDDFFYEELPRSEKLAVMTVYDEEGEDSRLTGALEKCYGTYLIIMNAADENHFNEIAEIIKHYRKNSSVLLLGRNLGSPGLEWFKKEFNN